MRRPSLISSTLAAALAAGAAFAGEGGAMTDGLLVSGAGAVAAAEAPARVRVDLARAASASEGVVILTLTPERIAPGEPFLVSIVAEDAAGGAREIASMSFFPPPREGEARGFPVDLSSLATEGETTLSVRLVPATSAALDETRVRVEGLRAGE